MTRVAVLRELMDFDLCERVCMCITRDLFVPLCVCVCLRVAYT